MGHQIEVEHLLGHGLNTAPGVEVNYFCSRRARSNINNCGKGACARKIEILLNSEGLRIRTRYCGAGWRTQNSVVLAGDPSARGGRPVGKEQGNLMMMILQGSYGLQWNIGSL